MHKGRLYELSGLGRIYSCQVAYPRWWPQTMQLAVSFWDGPYSASMSTKNVEAPYEDVDRDLGTFRYRGTVPSTGGHVVELELACALTADRLDIQSEFQIYYDGTGQTTSLRDPVWFTKWDNGGRIAIGPGVIPGYQLAWHTGWGISAVPY